MVTHFDFNEDPTSEVVHVYYSAQSQAIEQRVDSSSDAARQYVWHVGYVDDLLLRDRDTTSNGTLDERLYALTDVRYSVVAVANTSATVLERYRYDGHGKCTVLEDDFDVRSSTSYDWQFRYTGRREDLDTGLYYFRARFYHAQLGRFISRDPIGYVDGMSLYRAYFVPGGVDPSGLLIFGDDDWFSPTGPGFYPRPKSPTAYAIIMSLCADLKNSKRGSIRISRATMWRIIRLKQGYSKYGPTTYNPHDKLYWYFQLPTYPDSVPWDDFQRGCVGVTGCMLGGKADDIPNSKNENCFNTLAAAKAKAAEMKKLQSCDCPSVPVVIAKATSGALYDYGFYVEECNAFFHAENGFLSNPNTKPLLSTPGHFHNYHGSPGWSTLYCATCESDEYKE